ncbi:helix-turn-helix domain-containing protein [Sedimenticola selenatireducens]|uniref:Transcriptional regulator n=1 Tax=Sedimenticola selenatireducens TaxID=191960 RepID=A0A2N6CU57_9GAMM|nr:hypothetical protein [Sedimenticola selenatireducens]PLX60699.1 MAG: hypothetical protein C0630_14780 [Sedimenticola selenatireducens]
MSHLKIIKTNAEHQAALAELVRLLDNDPAEGSKEEDELEVLSILVEQYEAVNYPLESPDPVAAIRFRMEQRA